MFIAKYIFYRNYVFNLLFRIIRRTKTKFFNGTHLVWDEDSSAGKYVRDNCKTLQVSVNLEDLGEQYETPQIVEFQAGNFDKTGQYIWGQVFSTNNLKAILLSLLRRSQKSWTLLLDDP